LTLIYERQYIFLQVEYDATKVTLFLFLYVFYVLISEGVKERPFHGELAESKECKFI